MKCSCSIFLMPSFGYPSFMLLVMFRQAWLRVSSRSSVGWTRYRIARAEMIIRVYLVRLRNSAVYCWSMLYHIRKVRAISAIRVRYCRISVVEVIFLLVFQCLISSVLFALSDFFRVVLVSDWEILMEMSTVIDSMMVKSRTLIANSLGNMIL